MTSPNANEVGRVSIRVLPDMTLFRERVQAAVNEIKDLTVDVFANTDPFRDEIAAARQVAEQNAVEIPVNFNLDNNLRQRVASSQAGLSADVRVKWAPSAAVLKTELRALVLAASAGVSVDVEVNIDRNSIRNGLRDLSGELGNAGRSGAAAFGSGFSSVGNSFLNVGRIVRQAVTAFSALVVLAGPLVTAGAAITAAWGTVSTVLTAIPALIAAIGIPAGTVALGIIKIKEEFGKLQPEMDAIAKRVEDVFGLTLPRTVETIRPILVGLKDQFGFVAAEIGLVGLRIAESLRTPEAADQLILTFHNAKDAVTILGTAVESLIRSFLKITSLQSAMDSVTIPILNFSTAFEAMVNQLAGEGVLTNAFNGLKDVLVSLGSALVDLVENGIRLFAAAAPGITKVVDSLAGFFNRFDWNELGTAVSNVFTGIGETLDGVDQATIEAISDAFVQLGNTFRDPAIQQAFRTLIGFIPEILLALNRLIGMFAAVVTGAQGMATGLSGAGTIAGAAIDLLSGKITFAEFGVKFTEGSDIIGKGFGQMDKAALDGLKALTNTMDTGKPAVGTAVDGVGDAGAAAAAGIGPRIAAGMTQGQTALPPVIGSLVDATKPPPGTPEAVNQAWSAAGAGVGPAVTTGLDQAKAPIPPKVAEIAGAAAPTPEQKVVMNNAWEQFLFDVGLINEQGLLRIFDQTTAGTANIGDAYNIGTAPIPGQVQANLNPVADAATAGMTGLNTNVGQQWATVDQTTQTGVTNVGTSAGQTGPTITDNTRDLNNQLLEAAGRAIMDGLGNGIRAAAQAVFDFVSTIAGRIRELKGPLSYDKRLLIPEGKAIMGGLESGLRTGFGSVATFISSVAPRIANEFTGMDTTLADMMSTQYQPNNSFSPELSAQYSAAVQGEGVGSQVAYALAGWNVVIDADGIARLVNKSNTRRIAR